MPGPQPTLGYPSKAAAIRALRDDKGMEFKAIAAKLDIDATECRVVYWQAKNRHRREGKGRSTVHLSVSAIAQLKPHADRRGVNVTTLCRKLMQALLASPALIDNVLDDADEIIKTKASEIEKAA